MTQEAPRDARSEPQTLFRRQAVEANALGENDGDVLRLSPRWVGTMYRLLLWIVPSAFVFCLFTNVREYGTGAAVLRYSGIVDVAARRGGVVRAVEVHAGETVTAGTVLVRFAAPEEEAGLERIRREFELQLVRALRDPLDLPARQTLTSLRAEQNLAEGRLESFTIRAAFDGTVGDIRIRTGQYLNAGDLVLSLRRADATLGVVAFLPGHYLPQLKPNRPLRLEPEGYRYAYQQLVIDSVDDQVIGPSEVQRFLGPDLADSVKVQGPVVVVRARPPSQTFVANGQLYAYHHGMLATAEAPVRTVSILTALVPGLRFFSEGTPLGQ